MDAPLPVLVGPTASGKTDVAIHLALALDAEIVSIDSRQIFRGMEIGSAAPTPEQCRRVPHHLVGELDPEAGMTAGDYGRRVRERVAGIRGRGREAVLVGGSGLYLRAALGGLDEGLPRDPSLRERLRERARREGPEALHAELAARDPGSARSIAPRDAQRITRALEILHLTGSPPSLLRTRGRGHTLPARIAVLDRDREELRRRIRRRVEAMIDAGLEEEVRGLLARGLSADSAPLKSVGYAETVAMLRGELERDAWPEAVVRNTGRFAKRQRTWFRSLDAAWITVGASEPDAGAAQRVRRAWEGAADEGGLRRP